MTGLELLQEELLKKGFSRTQAEAKVVAGVLDILSKSENLSVYTDYLLAKRELANVREKVSRAREDAEHWAERARESLDDLSEANQELRALRRELDPIKQGVINEAMAEIRKELERCETPEAKDRIRLAELFKKDVHVDTKYDNTAFIVALGAIYAGRKIEPQEEIVKINSKFRG